MSYETTLLVTKVYDHSGGNDMIVAVDLSATGGPSDPVYKLLRQCREDVDLHREVYLPTRNKLVGEDDNGHKITAVPFQDMLAAMIKQNRRDKYRRFDLALAILDQFTTGWDDLTIELLQFGH